MSVSLTMEIGDSVLLTLLEVSAGCISPRSLLLTSMSSLCLYPEGQEQTVKGNESSGHFLCGLRLT